MISRNTRKGEDELQSTIKSLVTKLCTSEEFITQLTTIIANSISEKFNKEVESLREENINLIRKIEKQDEIINSLSNKVEKHEQIIRRKNVRLYGLKENDNEICLEVALDVLNTKMKLAVKKEDIEYCYRFGKRLKDKSRPLLIKFNTAYSKNLVYNNKKLLKNSRIVIREDLTANQLNLLKLSLEKVGTNGRVWSNFGTVFIKFNDENKIIKINNLDDVNHL